MNETEQAAFEILKAELGESLQLVKERTIEETVKQFASIAPAENSEEFWKTKIVPYLKDTVANNARSYNSDKYKEWQVQQNEMLEKAKKEWEQNHPSPTLPPAPGPDQKDDKTPTPPPPAIPKEIMEKLEELEKFKKAQEQEKAAQEMAAAKTAKRNKLAELMKRPEAGMPNEFLRDIIFDNFDFDVQEEDASLILKIQSKYNENIKKYTVDGVNPFANSGDSTGSSVTDFIKKVAEKDKKVAERNVLSVYTQKHSNIFNK